MKRLLTFLVLLASPLLAERFPFVEDTANVLNQETIASIATQLQTRETATGQQVAVRVIPSLGGETVERVASVKFHELGLGSQEKNNGVLFLVAINDHKSRIEVGYGLESKLTDTSSGRILDSLKPDFRAGDFNKGISSGVAQILASIDAPALPAPVKSEGWPWWVFFLLGLGGVGVIVFFIFWMRDDPEPEPEPYRPRYDEKKYRDLMNTTLSLRPYTPKTSYVPAAAAVAASELEVEPSRAYESPRHEESRHESSYSTPSYDPPSFDSGGGSSGGGGASSDW